MFSPLPNPTAAALPSARGGRTLAVPALQLQRDGSVMVVKWGEIGGQVLRPGDRLRLSEGGEGDYLLLSPQGLGRPMIGRLSPQGLVAEPGAVPASPQRWRPVGHIRCVERDLERATGATGPRVVVVRLHPSGNMGRRGGPEDAVTRFVGGEMSGPELDSLCLRAATGLDSFGVEVSIGAGPDLATAARLAELAPPGALCISLDEPAPVKAGTVITGPWRGWAEPVGVVQLPLFGDTPGAHER
jgi:hypothetical protein